MSILQIIQNLEQLNLDHNSAVVYIALYELGPSFAGPIVKKTKLHRMLVYQALERLADQQLVSVMQRRRKKYFQAADPKRLAERVHTLQAVAESTISQLHQLQPSITDQLHISVLHGHDGFVSNLETVVQLAAKGDKILRILGGVQGDLFYEAIGDWYKQYVALLHRCGVAKWQISPDSNSAAFKNTFAREHNTKLRTMAFSVASPIQTRITPEMVSIEIYAKDIVVIQIYNPAVAAGYLDYFNLLWKQAKSYLVSARRAVK